MLRQRIGGASVDVGRLSERRRQVRQLALLRVALLHAGGVSDICVVRNISQKGLSARVYRKLTAGDQVQVEFRSGELVSGSVVWEKQFDIGIVFPQPIDVARVLANQPCTQPKKRRALPRIAVACAGKLSNGLQSVDVTLRDISQAGANLEVRGQAPNFRNVQMSLPALPSIAGVVRWTDGSSVGLSFNECLSFETLARWIQARREGLELPSEERASETLGIRSFPACRSSGVSRAG